MKRLMTVIVVVAALICGLSTLGGSATPKHKAKAKLFGSTPTMVKGYATFDQKKIQGHACRRLKIHIKQALPLQSFQVTINGQSIGTIHANAGGVGKLDYCTKKFKVSGQKTLPSGFPKLDTGDLITVGPLQGVFFDKFDPKKQKYAVCGSGEHAGSQANVEYREHSKNGALDRLFTVELSNAEPWQSVPIFVFDQFIGALEPGDDGHATFTLRTEAFIDPNGDAQPMPFEFPSLQPGDTVQVGNAFVPLADCAADGDDDDDGDDEDDDDDDDDGDDGEDDDDDDDD